MSDWSSDVCSSDLKYLRQIRFQFSQDYMEDTLADHAAITRTIRSSDELGSTGKGVLVQICTRYPPAEISAEV